MAVNDCVLYVFYVHYTRPVMGQCFPIHTCLRLLCSETTILAVDTRDLLA